MLLYFTFGCLISFLSPESDREFYQITDKGLTLSAIIHLVVFLMSFVSVPHRNTRVIRLLIAFLIFSFLMVSHLPFITKNEDASVTCEILFAMPIVIAYSAIKTFSGEVFTTKYLRLSALSAIFILSPRLNSYRLNTTDIIPYNWNWIAVYIISSVFVVCDVSSSTLDYPSSSLKSHRITMNFDFRPKCLKLSIRCLIEMLSVKAMYSTGLLYLILGYTYYSYSIKVKHSVKCTTFALRYTVGNIRFCLGYKKGYVLSGVKCYVDMIKFKFYFLIKLNNVRLLNETTKHFVIKEDNSVLTCV